MKASKTNRLNIMMILMLVISVGLYANTPTHNNVSYGSESRQWLNIYKASSSVPTPLYIWAHPGGSTANDVPDAVSDLKAAGITTISWESVPNANTADRVNTIWDDAQLVLEWVKNNASTYNFDINNIIVGGQSRGSVASWKLAHCQDPGIKGIYMAQAITDGRWTPRAVAFYYFPDGITVNSPPMSLNYVESPGTTDIHDPENGMILVNRYIELGIGNKAELHHSLGSRPACYNDLVDFCESVIDTSPAPTPASN